MAEQQKDNTDGGETKPEASQVDAMEVETPDESAQARKTDHKEEKVEYVFSSNGLFPSCHSKARWVTSRVNLFKLFINNALAVLSRATGGVEEMDKLFTFLGRFIGKAVLDGRQLDMPLSETFFKWLRGDPLGLADLRSVNPTVHQSLSSLNELCKAKQLIERDKPEVHIFVSACLRNC